MSAVQLLWDPAGWPVDTTALAGEQRYLATKLAELSHDPDRPRRTFWWLVAAGAMAASATLGLTQPADPQIWFLVTVACFTPAGAHYTTIRSLENDLVKSLVAQSQQWAYSPTDNPLHWRHLQTFFPEVFTKGNENQHVTDEFWGTYAGRFAATPFWIGEFVYTQEHEKSRSTYQALVFAIQLREPIQTELIILPEVAGGRLRRLFGRTDLDLESGDFNRLFRITYRRYEDKKEQKIYQVLNPAVMATLIDFRQAVGKFEAIFRDQVLLVSLPSKVLRPKYTSFLRKVAIDPRDTAELTASLDRILQFANTVIQQLD